MLRSATWSDVILACLFAAFLAFSAGLVLTFLIRLVTSRFGLRVTTSALWRSPLPVLFVVVALRSALQAAEAQRRWTADIVQVLDVAIIVVAGWILTVVVEIGEQAALNRFPDTGLADVSSRHARTKISLLSRLAAVVVVAVTLIAVLFAIPAVRAVGFGLLTSAGVLGIIAGLAAQTSLANVFAGLQIAFTNAIRVNDIVVIEEHRGAVEEITLTHVVVRKVDRTTVILPCTYFIATPYINWTHNSTAVTGIIDLLVDWRVRLDDLRAELDRVLAASPNWDGKLGQLHVEDVVVDAVKLIILVSAPDGNHINALKWEVREALVRYIDQTHPGAVPRSHTTNTERGADAGP